MSFLLVQSKNLKPPSSYHGRAKNLCGESPKSGQMALSCFESITVLQDEHPYPTAVVEAACLVSFPPHSSLAHIHRRTISTDRKLRGQCWARAPQFGRLSVGCRTKLN